MDDAAVVGVGEGMGGLSSDLGDPAVVGCALGWDVGGWLVVGFLLVEQVGAFAGVGLGFVPVVEGGVGEAGVVTVRAAGGAEGERPEAEPAAVERSRRRERRTRSSPEPSMRCMA